MMPISGAMLKSAMRFSVRCRLMNAPRLLLSLKSNKRRVEILANPKPKLSPKERLAKVLKQNSNIPELAEFRIQCRDVFRLGGVLGLDEWIDARRDYGLLNHSKHLLKAADDLQGLLGSVIDEATNETDTSADWIDLGRASRADK